jgi:hypothetical protein
VLDSGSATMVVLSSAAMGRCSERGGRVRDGVGRGRETRYDETFEIKVVEMDWTGAGSGTKPNWSR